MLVGEMLAHQRGEDKQAEMAANMRINPLYNVGIPSNDRCLLSQLSRRFKIRPKELKYIRVLLASTA